MGQPMGKHVIDLNTATSAELARLPGIGSDKAWDLIQHRPYLNWEDVKRVPGFTEEAVEVLRQAERAFRLSAA